MGGSFEDMMYNVGKKMQKGMDADSVLESIKEGNELDPLLGTHVFLVYTEVIGFLGLLKN